MNKIQELRTRIAALNQDSAFKKPKDSFYKKKVLTVPNDVEDIISIDSIRTLVTSYEYIACKKHDTIERPDFFSKGVTKKVFNNLAYECKNLYAVNFIDQAIELDLSISQVKKFYAIINSTKDVFLPEITTEELLPFVIKKILVGKIDTKEFLQISPAFGKIDLRSFETGQGHSWLEKEAFVQKLVKAGFSENEVVRWVEEFAHETDGVIMYKQYYHDDHKLRDKILSIQCLQFDTVVPDIDSLVLADYLSDDQKEAIAKIVLNPICMLNGGAGSGKTTTVNSAVEAVGIEKSRCLAIAPTHKAKMRMCQTPMVRYGRSISDAHGKTFDLTGPQTAHALGYRAMFIDTKETFDVLVVDEIGMMGSEHSPLITAIIKTFKIKRVIFVGDRNQLNPVGLGSLVDLLNSVRTPSATLTTCHRSVKSISNLCTKILENNHISKDCLDLIDINSSYIHSNDNGFISLFTPIYKEILFRHWDRDNKKEFVAVSYTNLAVKRLNILTHVFLLDHELLEVDDIDSHKTLCRLAYMNADKHIDYTPLLLVGDVVIATSHHEKLVKGSRGEITALRTDKFDRVFATVSMFDTDMNGDRIVVSDVPCDILSMAYGCTVHSMQGDEANTIVYVWSNADTQSLAYTACSRPKEHLYAIVPASDEAFVPLNKDVKRITTFGL